MTKIEGDEQLIAMWLHGKGKLTQSLYAREAEALLNHAGKSIAELTLRDLQEYQRSIIRLRSSTRATKTGIAKSLMAFATKVGYSRRNESLLLEPLR